MATGAFPFDFSSPEHLVPLLGLIASFYSIVAHWMSKRFWLSFAIRTVIGTAVAAALIYQSQTVPILGKALRCIAFGVSFAVVWSVLEALSEVQHPSLFSVNLLICAAFTSAAVFVAHTAVVSQMVAVFASVCAASFVFYLWMRDAKFSGGMVAVSTVLIFGFIINGLFYADLPVLSAFFAFIFTNCRPGSNSATAKEGISFCAKCLDINSHTLGGCVRLGNQYTSTWFALSVLRHFAPQFPR